MDVSPSVLRRARARVFDDRSDTLRVFVPDREAYAQAAPSHDLPSNEASRGFLPWRLSDDGPRRRGSHHHGTVIRNPAHLRTWPPRSNTNGQSCSTARSI